MDKQNVVYPYVECYSLAKRNGLMRHYKTQIHYAELKKPDSEATCSIIPIMQ